MARSLCLFVLFAMLTGCAVRPPAPLPALGSAVPIDASDRADLLCYYGPLW